MKKLMVAAFAFQCVAATASSLVDGVLTFDVASGDTENYTGDFAGVVEIRKKGAGKAYLKLGVNVQSAFAGKVVVEKGTMGADDLLNWGVPTGFEIQPGGALDLTAATGHSASPSNLKKVPVLVGGNGVDGSPYGAIFLTAMNGSGNLFEQIFCDVKLSADTIISSPARWTVGGAIDFNGFSLIHRGSGFFSFESVTVTNPGRVINREGTFNLGGNTSLGGAGEIVLEGGILNFWRQAKDVGWNVVASKTTRIEAGSNKEGTYGIQNVIAAPIVHTNGTLALRPAAGASLTVKNTTITTSDRLFPSGSTTVSGPYLCIESTGSVLFDNVVVSNDISNTKSECLDIRPGNFEWTAPKKRSYLSRVGWTSTNAWVHDAGHIDIKQGKNWFLEASSRGSATPPRLILEGTELIGPYDQTTYGNYQTMYLANSGVNRSGVFVIGEGAVFTNGIMIGGKGQATVYQRGGEFGWLSTNAMGNEEIANGCYYLAGGHCARLANYTIGRGGDGFHRQTGGTFERKAGNEAYVGVFGYGEMCISGGSYVNASRHRMLYPDPGAAGIYALKVDPFPEAQLTVTGAGTLFDNNSTFCFNEATQACQTVVNVNDGGIFRVQRMQRGHTQAEIAGARSYVNLNGGVLRFALGNIYDSRNNAAYAPDAVTLYEKGVVLDTTDMAPEDMDKANPGTNMRDYIILNWKLQAATGKGVCAIALPTDSKFLAEKFAGPTHVRIVDSSGSGYGASAVMDWDPETGAVKGIIVTSHGCNYDPRSTYATVDSALGYTNRYVCAVSLADNGVDGGIVKRGPFTLKLNYPNVFSGGVVIEEGALVTMHDKAIPDGNALTLRGGSLGLRTATTTLSLSSVSGYGVISNGSFSVSEALSVAAADLLAGRCVEQGADSSLTFGNGAVVALTGYGKLSDADKRAFEDAGCFTVAKFSSAYAGALPQASGLPSEWKLAFANGRRELCVRKRKGLFVICR